MAREAKQIGNYVVDELYRYRTVIEEQDYMKYDEVTVYGNDVVNLMKAELTGRADSVYITVVDGAVSNTYKEREDIEKVQQPGSVYYIRPVEEYEGRVIRNENEVITEIIFRKKTEE